MDSPTFTNSELEDMAEFICGRVDALTDMLENGVNYSDSMKNGLKRDIRHLSSLNNKLRPYFKNRT